MEDETPLLHPAKCSVSIVCVCVCVCGQWGHHKDTRLLPPPPGALWRSHQDAHAEKK